MKLHEAFEKIGQVFRELDPDHELSPEIEKQIDALAECKSTLAALMTLGSIGLDMIKSVKAQFSAAR